MSTPAQQRTTAILLNIRNIRIAKQYSQLYIAAKLGISQNAYSKIELGYSSISLGTLIRVAEILEVGLPQLVAV